MTTILVAMATVVAVLAVLALVLGYRLLILGATVGALEEAAGLDRFSIVTMRRQIDSLEENTVLLPDQAVLSKRIKDEIGWRMNSALDEVDIKDEIGLRMNSALDEVDIKERVDGGVAAYLGERIRHAVEVNVRMEQALLGKGPPPRPTLRASGYGDYL